MEGMDLRMLQPPAKRAELIATFKKQLAWNTCQNDELSSGEKKKEGFWKKCGQGYHLFHPCLYIYKLVSYIR